MKLLADPGLIRGEIDRRLHELRAANPATTQKSRLELELNRCARTITRLLQAYQEELVLLEELRERMPELRQKKSTIRAQLDALEMETIDQKTYVALAENLENFLRRLRDGAEKSSIEDRQRVVRLLVKDVLVGPERIVIRHSIPTRSPDPGGSYPLCGRSHHPTLRYTFTSSPKQAFIYMTCFDESPEQRQESCIPDPFPHTFHQQLVVHRVEVAGKITFDHPATRRIGTVL